MSIHRPPLSQRQDGSIVLKLPLQRSSNLQSSLLISCACWQFMGGARYVRDLSWAPVIEGFPCFRGTEQQSTLSLPRRKGAEFPSCLSCELHSIARGSVQLPGNSWVCGWKISIVLVICKLLTLVPRLVRCSSAGVRMMSVA